MQTSKSHTHAHVVPWYFDRTHTIHTYGGNIYGGRPSCEVDENYLVVSISYPGQTGKLGSSRVADLEDVARLDDDVVHVDELEAGEVSRDGDEVHGGTLVELEQARVVEVALPPQLPQPPLQDVVRGHHLAARHMHQHFARPRPAPAAAAGRLAVRPPHDPVLEYPHASHASYFTRL
uniref:Uncharacterized protein n=1 Tax=Triticum urartu TaxID=4572 RepID=A0A8R7PEP3_TRIUA